MQVKPPLGSHSLGGRIAADARQGLEAAGQMEGATASGATLAS
jgi:hypothetical protein